MMHVGPVPNERVPGVVPLRVRHVAGSFIYIADDEAAADPQPPDGACSQANPPLGGYWLHVRLLIRTAWGKPPHF